jgi:hypothetical protein
MQELEIKLIEQQRSNGRESVVCFNCKAKGHYQTECPKDKIKRTCKTCGKNNHSTEQCFKNHTCNKCGRKGHTERVCKTNSRQINLCDSEYESEEYEIDSYSEDEEEVYSVERYQNNKNEYDAEISDDEEELFVTLRSGKTYGKGNKYKSTKTKHPSKTKPVKKVKIRDPKDPNEMEIDDERIRVKKYKEPSEIQKLPSYNIVQDLMNSPANATFAQILQNPKFCKELKQALKSTQHQELADE